MAVLAPILPGFLAAHPDVQLEISVDDALIDIVEHGFDERVLDDWCPATGDLYLYYSSRRHLPAALRALIDVLKAAT